MSEGKWLEQYSGETTEHLIELEGEYRTDSIIIAFEQAVDQKAARIGLDKLTDVEKTVLAVEALEREVNNGGYSQFFTNSSNEFASVIVEALTGIGSQKTAAITSSAIDALNIKGPITIEAIEGAMDAEDGERDEKLNKCDDLYYDASEPIADYLFEYIKSNSSQIVL